MSILQWIITLGSMFVRGIGTQKAQNADLSKLEFLQTWDQGIFVY